MKIRQIKQSFKNSELKKPEFIDLMSDVHSVLFDYSRELKNTEISKIEISDDKIVMTSRQTNYHSGGIKFFCDELDKRNVTLEAFNFGTYEQEDSEMLYKLIQPEDYVFDIGANIGWYVAHIAASQTTGKVYAFEPIPETFEKLKSNIELNQLSNVALNNIALSEKKQILTFFYSPKQTGASSSQNITENQDILKLDCQSITLDDFVNQNRVEKLDFIKCDVEGAELFVFQGGLNSIRKFRPVIFTETLRKWSAKFGYHPNDILSLFKNEGYQCFFVEDSKLCKIEEVTEETTQTNFFLLHKEQHHQDIQRLSKSK